MPVGPETFLVERDGIDSLSGNSCQSSHIWPQYGWNFNRAVRLLVIFQDSYHGSSDGQTGSIQRVDKVGLRVFLSTTRPILDAGSPGLKRFEIAAGRNLPTEVCTDRYREPIVWSAPSVSLLKIRFTQHAHDVDAGPKSLKDHPIIARS